MHGNATYNSAAPVIRPRRVCVDSWWMSASPKDFTHQCRAHLFGEEQSDRDKRKAAGVEAVRILEQN